MKKIFLVFFLVLKILCVFAQNGVIRELSGIVELKAPGALSFVAAKTGDSVSQDMIISTGLRSQALIEVGSAQITVRPLTRLTLKEIRRSGEFVNQGLLGNLTLMGSHGSGGVETLNVHLQAGRVRVDVNPPAGTRASMTVVGPSATASVRGTSFELDTRSLQVIKGQVSFLGSRGNSTIVNAGFDSKVDESGKAADSLEVKFAGLKPRPPVGSGISEGSPVHF